MNEQFVQRLYIDWDKIDKNSYLRKIEAIKDLKEIVFEKSITFLVGENGSGKSTVLEALAVAYGFNPEGGTKNYSFSTYDSHSQLHEAIRVSRGYRKAKWGYFLRAESFYNVATNIEKLDDEEEDSWTPPILTNYGGISLHEKSHGESFLALVENRFGGNGLYILDEPEAALSPMRLMRLMYLMQELVKKDSQFIISTHSPILMTFPDAEILEITEEGICSVDYKDTEHFIITKRFMDAPEKMIESLLRE